MGYLLWRLICLSERFPYMWIVDQMYPQPSPSNLWLFCPLSSSLIRQIILHSLLSIILACKQWFRRIEQVLAIILYETSLLLINDIEIYIFYTRSMCILLIVTYQYMHTRNKKLFNEITRLADSSASKKVRTTTFVRSSY